VCNAVAYAHSRGVLHRDLKPGNIMLGQYGETLVVDWGLAKPVGRGEAPPAGDEQTLRPPSAGDVAATRAGEAIGTPGYMSPEQAAGRLDQLGPASDIYGLGATLYALLTGRPPFRGPDAGAVLQQVQRGEVPPPRQVNARVPPALDAVCRKAMALEPAGRYATALALAADVEHWLADEPVSAWREPWGVRLGRWVRRHRTSVAAAAAALLVASVSLALATARLAAANHRLEEANGREREARATAQANYRMARDAVEQYLTKVTENPRLKVGGLRGLRKELLQEAGMFYTRFLRESPDDPGLAADRANAYMKLGDIARDTAAHKVAIEAYQQAAALYAQLADAHPDVPQHQADLALSYDKLGFSSLHLGRTADAEKEKQKALAIRQKLADAYPEVPEYQSDLGVSHDNLATVYFRQGKRAESERESLRAKALLEKVAGAHPEVAKYQGWLANTLYNLGTSYLNWGRLAEAEQAFVRAIPVLQKLADAHPDTPRFLQSLGRGHSNLSKGVLEAGQIRPGRGGSSSGRCGQGESCRRPSRCPGLPGGPGPRLLRPGPIIRTRR
jgi:serine/threonine-protein kinase